MSYRNVRAGLDDVAYQQLYSGFHFGGLNVSGITSGYALISDLSGFATWQVITVAAGGLPSSGVFTSSLSSPIYRLHSSGNFNDVADILINSPGTSDNMMFRVKNAAGTLGNSWLIAGTSDTKNFEPSSDLSYNIGDSTLRPLNTWLNNTYTRWLWAAPVQSGGITTSAGGLHLNGMSGLRITGHVHPSTSGALDSDNVYDMGGWAAKWANVRTVGLVVSGTTSGNVLTSDSSGIGTWQLSPALTLPSSGVIASSLLVERVYSHWIYAMAVQSGGITTSAGGLHLNGLSGLRITGHVAPSTSGATDLDNDRDMGISTARWRNTWSMGGIFDSGVSGYHTHVQSFSTKTGFVTTDYTVGDGDYALMFLNFSGTITLPSKTANISNLGRHLVLGTLNTYPSGAQRVIVAESGQYIRFRPPGQGSTVQTSTLSFRLSQNAFIHLVGWSGIAFDNDWLCIGISPDSGSVTAPGV